MSLDPRTPVLVGVAAVDAASAGLADPVTPEALMIAAARAAAADAGAPDLLRRVGWVDIGFLVELFLAISSFKAFSDFATRARTCAHRSPYFISKCVFVTPAVCGCFMFAFLTTWQNSWLA